MKLYYNNVEIYKDVSMNYCVHEMNSETFADSLTVRFNDVSGMWSGWNPEQNDILRIKYDYADTGDMYIHTVVAENGIFMLRALSLPVGVREKKTRNWEGISFKRIVAKIAKENNLSYKLYGVTEQVYKFLTQDAETDFQFLEKLCEYESCSMMIYNKSIVVYSQPYVESRSGESLQVGDNGKFHYINNGNAYESCTVSNGKYTGSYSTGKSGAALNIVNIPAMSNGEAIRFAKGMLRKANKNALEGKITKSLQTQCAAGSVIELETSKASIFSRKVFISKIRNDYIRNQSDIFFRGCLEGY